MQKQSLQKLFKASQKVYRPVQIQNKNLSFFSDQNQFTKHQDIINNYRHTQSFTERLQLTVKYALNAYLQSQNPRYLSELGSLTSDHSVEYLREQMRKDDEGQLILKEQPRVNNSTVDLEYLLSLEKNTFGYAYGHFMNSHKFNSEDRPVSRYIQDLELAYIFQRYKEIHDFIHVLLGYDVTVKDELIGKKDATCLTIMCHKLFKMQNHVNWL
ncbi:hypothetical protein PPERSA_02659 [Pseudocohnilembus persalinus]|uniref:Coenzyme Q biosynthesis protein 4 homolog n=1 Tax=Pseudocohnilembus persalinus TaxID=266149 RepID=A0A0V0R5N4_PSEPJ|nr:hypothetical protein PPERSA_02659 [Pseudocohnilembus persalinus]|eukprot:KRX09787.1 hypothetical protein PPERSA_02659 [Pseudocohnilembus persalinus]